MKVKRYAASRKVSVSQIVEEHFAALTKPSRKRGLLDLLDKLPHRPVPEGDLIKLYYQQRRKKYGF